MVGTRAAVFGLDSLANAPVLVIGEDKRSLDHPRLANIPRALFSPIYAELGTKMFAHGAQGMVLDIIMAFDSKDLKVGEETPLRRYDVPFLKLLRSEQKRGRVVLGRSSELLPARRFAQMAGTLGLALVPVTFDEANVIRRAPTWLEVRDQDDGYPTLSGRALSLLGVVAPQWVNLMPRAPLTTLPSASLIDVLECEDPAALERLLDGRVVFLGGMLPSEDRLRTPDQLIRRADLEPEAVTTGASSEPCDFNAPHTRDAEDRTLPGVFIHAAAVDAVASGWHSVPALSVVEYGVVFVAAFVAAFLAFHLSTTLGAAALIGLMLTVFGIAVLAFQSGVYLPTSWSLAGAPIALVAGYGVRIRLVDRKSNLIRREFGRYLSPVLVQQMIDQNQMPRMGGEEREVTVMFADLTGFTAASEVLESAKLVAILNRYLDAIAETVQENGGYVDKFIGDAVMAMFNAPADVDDHALRAVTAAQQIIRRVRKMAEDDAAAGEVHFDIKVGISTGSSTVGNVGSQDRVNYTVIGENVNLASRFEGLPSVLGTRIVIGPEAARRVR
ncbi:MAG: adenylate/guanylate cyclase domain-containing protein, partial [Pseudomonadota bacterium]